MELVASLVVVGVLVLAAIAYSAYRLFVWLAEIGGR